MVSEIVAEIQELTALNKKGVEALYEAEMALAKCEADLDRLEAQAFINGTGSVAERQAFAKLECVQVRFARDVSKAQESCAYEAPFVESALMAQALCRS